MIHFGASALRLCFVRFMAIVRLPGVRWETADWSFGLIQEI